MNQIFFEYGGFMHRLFIQIVVQCWNYSAPKLLVSGVVRPYADAEVPEPFPDASPPPSPPPIPDIECIYEGPAEEPPLAMPDPPVAEEPVIPEVTVSDSDAEGSAERALKG